MAFGLLILITIIVVICKIIDFFTGSDILKPYEEEESKEPVMHNRSNIKQDLKKEPMTYNRVNNEESYEEAYEHYCDDDHGGSWDPERGGTYGDESYEEWLESNDRD